MGWLVSAGVGSGAGVVLGSGASLVGAGSADSSGAGSWVSVPDSSDEVVVEPSGLAEAPSLGAGEGAVPDPSVAVPVSAAGGASPRMARISPLNSSS